MAIVSQCLLPRGKFLKIMFSIILATCASASICCLAVLSAVRARIDNHSTSDVQGPYDSSACAVSAVWLLFAIWCVCTAHGTDRSAEQCRISNTLRAYHPVLLQDPMVAFSIFSGVALTRAGQFLTVEQGLEFIRQLLITFLLGFAVATVVSLMIVPISSRRNVFKDIMAYAKAIEMVCEAQQAYIKIAERVDHPGRAKTSDGNVDVQFGGRDHREVHNRIESDEREEQLKLSMAALVALHDKMAADLTLAESEMAWGKLDNTELRSIFVLFRAVMLPLAGICMVPDILREFSAGWVHEDEPRLTRETWTSFLEAFRQELERSAELVTLAIQHAVVVLGIARAGTARHMDLTPRVSQQPDIEKRAQELVPGHAGFTPAFETKVREIYDQRGTQAVVAAGDGAHPEEAHVHSDTIHSGNERYTEETLTFFFLQHLTDALLKGSLNIVRFADQGIGTKMVEFNRVIFPTAGAIPWFSTKRNSNASRSPTAKEHRITKHSSATNLWQRSGKTLGLIPHILASEQSSFGFRAAAASFSVAILAYLRQTQNFFFEQRLIWVLIVIVIGMSPTSGASLFSFAVRIVGTIISLVLSLAIWYVVVGHTAGVIVLLYIGNMFGVGLTLANSAGLVMFLLTVTVLFLRQVPQIVRSVSHLHRDFECHHRV